MNGTSNSSNRLRPRSRRGVAAIVGTLLVSAPVVASAAETESTATAPIDLRQSLAMQHQRLLDGFSTMLGEALVRSSELRFSLQDTVTFGLTFDDLVSVEQGDEDGTEPETELDEPELDDEDFVEVEPVQPRRRARAEYSDDSSDPLAGLF